MTQKHNRPERTIQYTGIIATIIVVLTNVPLLDSLIDNVHILTIHTIDLFLSVFILGPFIPLVLTRSTDSTLIAASSVTMLIAILGLYSMILIQTLYPRIQ